MIKFAIATVLVVGLASCAPRYTEDNPPPPGDNSYAATFGFSGYLASKRDEAKWKALEDAGWCIPRNSFFPRPKPNCIPLPPGGVYAIDMHRPAQDQTGITTVLKAGPKWPNPSQIVKPRPVHVPSGFPRPF